MAEFRLYELRLLISLHELVGPTVAFSSHIARQKLKGASRFRPDAVMTVEDRDVIVEIKHTSRPLKFADRMISRSVESIRGKGLTDPVLLVTSEEVEIPDSVRLTLAVETVRWRGPMDDEALKDALERASKLSPWRHSD
ncbi:hypothetical protein [Cryobacterium sp. TMS1-13-1]|uniref:hypothetical protein n=1 Tax=Cryobacterium sp. TMS1-13-1 TaxID=1259220 RepID=UPI001A7E1775|nr:hypothetical protein [Cryobacterium sp. TMS1-13-1]